MDQKMQTTRGIHSFRKIDRREVNHIHWVQIDKMYAHSATTKLSI